MAPGLYLAATPIGNLRDITLRALDILAGADLVLCEDTRVGGKLLAAHGLEARLERYDEHAAERARPKLLAMLAAGERIGLISAAGTPLISDPGYRLAREAAAAGATAVPIPRPSALLAALSSHAAHPPLRLRGAGARATLIFFEAYFSNFIEGTEFESARWRISPSATGAHATGPPMRTTPWAPGGWYPTQSRWRAPGPQPPVFQVANFQKWQMDSNMTVRIAYDYSVPNSVVALYQGSIDSDPKRAHDAGIAEHSLWRRVGVWTAISLPRPCNRNLAAYNALTAPLISGRNPSKTGAYMLRTWLAVCVGSGCLLAQPAMAGTLYSLLDSNYVEGYDAGTLQGQGFITTNTAQDLAVGSGSIYVSSASQIYRYSTAGALKATSNVPSGLNVGAIALDGGEIYSLLDGNYVESYDAASLQGQGFIATTSADDLAVSDGSIYVSSSSQIYRYSMAGVLEAASTCRRALQSAASRWMVVKSTVCWTALTSNATTRARCKAKASSPSTQRTI